MPAAIESPPVGQLSLLRRHRYGKRNRPHRTASTVDLWGANNEGRIGNGSTTTGVTCPTSPNRRNDRLPRRLRRCSQQRNSQRERFCWGSTIAPKPTTSLRRCLPWSQSQRPSPVNPPCYSARYRGNCMYVCPLKACTGIDRVSVDLQRRRNCLVSREAVSGLQRCLQRLARRVAQGRQKLRSQPPW